MSSSQGVVADHVFSTLGANGTAVLAKSALELQMTAWASEYEEVEADPVLEWDVFLLKCKGTQ